MSKTRASCFITSKQMKAPGLRPRAFICFEVFGTRDEALALVFDILHLLWSLIFTNSCIKNWLQTTPKQRKTWWNQKSLGCLFTNLTWACFEMPSSSLRTSLSSTTLLFDYRESSELWSSQLWTQFKQLRIEAWKSQDFNGVWTRDLARTIYETFHISLHITENISFKAEFTLSNSSVKVGFTDITISILEKSRALHFFEASLQLWGK